MSCWLLLPLWPISSILTPWTLMKVVYIFIIFLFQIFYIWCFKVRISDASNKLLDSVHHASDKCYCRGWDFQRAEEMMCLHDRSCEDHDCSTDWSLYKHHRPRSNFSSLHKTNQNLFTLWPILVLFLKCPNWFSKELNSTPLKIFLMCTDISFVNYNVPLA